MSQKRSGNSSNTRLIHDGANVPNLQQVPKLVKKGANVPTMQPVTKPSTGSNGSSQGGQNNGKK
jgi:hypothetical protein